MVLMAYLMHVFLLDVVLNAGFFYKFKNSSNVNFERMSSTHKVTVTNITWYIKIIQYSRTLLIRTKIFKMLG